MINKEIEKRVCVICNMENESYLYDNYIDGIIVNGEYICRHCEKEIIETSVEENKYDDYVDKIKVVIYK
ncbi:sigma factor G inhibitor Gin [Clostridium thermobutyricum]|uniref:Inhibitor of sigma-G Gin n=1 Tax=Clostridium thermobutyricum DSM 4928 TaxID=1121339 RepID=A0A1V4SSA8_9CLOT|nr:sigma factor G inhibitor Gin [Clostridium thermobutyricum]OPX46683.1 inhibitor of sigma-G Gin [Clostridium thermobutyricum DSM 4928]